MIIIKKLIYFCPNIYIYLMKNYLLSIFTIALFSCSNIENNEQPTNNEVQTPVPLREVKTLEAIIAQIKADTAWYKLIETKAKEQNLSVDSVLLGDAKYMEVIESEVVKIENQIIQSPEWFDLVSKKAKEEGVSIDERLKTEASWVNEENKKKINP